MAPTTSVLRLLLLALLPCSVLAGWRVDGHNPIKERLRLKHAKAPHSLIRRRQSPSAYKHLNKNTEKFLVNGTSIPLVDWDLGESYAGHLPISKDANETRKLFFWYFPTANEKASNEVAIWLNGGPGCSSLIGLFTEHGPFTWFPGTYRPVYNIFSWSQLSNVLYIDQPAGTGFSVGSANVTNEEEVAQQFLGFYQNWMETFGTKGRKTYLTGESYAGVYLPYIGDAMIKSKQAADFNLSGSLMFSPYIADNNFQQAIATKPFLDENNNVMGVYPGTSEYYDQIQIADKQCGFAAIREKLLKFPPSGHAPPMNLSDACDTADMAYAALADLNPCANIYSINQGCPQSSDPLLWAADSDNSSVPAAFDRHTWHGYPNLPEMRKALHIPEGQSDWGECGGEVFGQGGDQSPDPVSSGVLTRLIEHTNNVIIGSGSHDYRVPTNGTLVVLQNMTWNGGQGFDEFPSKPLNLPIVYSDLSSQSSGGKVGDWTQRKGLTFARVYLAGHELPRYSQGGGYRLFERLLNRIPDLSSKTMFSALPGNFTDPLNIITNPPQ